MMDYQETRWKVCVQCWTFNHAKYIEETLNGFVLQETTFPYVCCIIDDASTDGETGIIKRYMQAHFSLSDESIVRKEDTDDYTLLFAQHKSNKQCFFAALFLKYNHYSIKKSTFPYICNWNDRSKYVAWCEGDDFWVESLKLQKQVGFMDTHPDYSMCFHAVNFLYPDGDIKESHRYDTDNKECNIKDFLLTRGGYAKICSVLYDREKYGVGFEEWTENPSVGDWPMQATLFAKGKVAYIDSVMSTYRVSADGSWTNKMRSDYRAMRNHHKSVATNWKLFDKWTGGKYHEYISFQLKDNKIVYRNRQLEFFLQFSVIKKLREFLHSCKQ